MYSQFSSLSPDLKYFTIRQMYSSLNTAFVCTRIYPYFIELQKWLSHLPMTRYNELTPLYYRSSLPFYLYCIVQFSRNKQWEKLIAFPTMK